MNRILQRTSATVFIALIGFLFALPVLRPPTFVYTFLFTAFIYLVLAEGWNIIGGYTGYPNLGQVTFFGAGAYVTAILASRYGITALITAPLGGLVAVAVAAGIGYPTLRLRGPYFAIATLVITFILQLLMLHLDVAGGAVGLYVPPLPYDPWTVRTIYYVAGLILSVMTVAVAIRIERSKFGLQLKSIRGDEDAAEVLGVDTTRLKVYAFCISAFFPGVIGGLYSEFTTYIDPIAVFDPLFSFNAILMTALGGEGKWLGPIIGVTLMVPSLVFLPTLIGGALNIVAYGVLLMSIILFAPKGILGIFGRRRLANP